MSKPLRNLHSRILVLFLLCAVLGPTLLIPVASWSAPATDECVQAEDTLDGDDPGVGGGQDPQSEGDPDDYDLRIIIVTMILIQFYLLVGRC